MLHSWVQSVTVSILYVTLLGEVCNSEYPANNTDGVQYVTVSILHITFLGTDCNSEYPACYTPGYSL